MNRLAWFVVLGAAVYFGVCYYPVGVKYVRVRYAAQALAQATVDSSSRGWSQVRGFVESVERDTGVRLSTADVSLTGPDGESRVEVRVGIPVHFRGLDESHEHRFTITTQARRPGHVRDLK